MIPFTVCFFVAYWDTINPKICMFSYIYLDMAEEAFEEYKDMKRTDILIVVAKYKESIPDYIYDRF